MLAAWAELALAYLGRQQNRGHRRGVRAAWPNSAWRWLIRRVNSHPVP